MTDDQELRAKALEISAIAIASLPENVRFNLFDISLDDGKQPIEVLRDLVITCSLHFEKYLKKVDS